MMNLQTCNNNYGKHANIYYEVGSMCPLCMLLEKEQYLRNEVDRLNNDVKLNESISYVYRQKFDKIEDFIKSIHPEIDY